MRAAEQGAFAFCDPVPEPVHARPRGVAAAHLRLHGAAAVEQAPAAGTREIRLYEWQSEAVQQLRDGIRAGRMNQVLASPTGSGKTTMSAYLIDECHKKGRRAVFICDRTALVDQTSRLFDEFGIPHGIIQGDHWRYLPDEPIQIASAQTLQRRKLWPEADLVIVDEAHSRNGFVWDHLLRRVRIAIGLTATPFTKGLGRIYKGAVTVRTTRQLIQDGYLVDFDIWSASEPDMQGVPLNKKREWEECETAKRAMPIVGDVVSEYLKHGHPRKFIAFGVNIEHCRELQQQMMAAGVQCGLYTYKEGDAEREALLREFRDPNGYLQGLVSIAALAKGFDNPAVEVVILARPLRNSLAEHIQMMGRGLRRDPDNPSKRCIILDHAGNCRRFWSDMQDFFENGVGELDDGTRKPKTKSEKKAAEPYKCPRCASVHSPRPMCPMCGHEYPRRSEVEHVPGTLSELTGYAAGSGDDRQSFYSQLLGLARERGWSERAADHRYRERYGVWPRGLEAVPAPPTRKTRDWVRSRLIAWAKSKERAEVRA